MQRSGKAAYEGVTETIYLIGTDVHVADGDVTDWSPSYGEDKTIGAQYLTAWAALGGSYTNRMLLGDVAHNYTYTDDAAAILTTASPANLKCVMGNHEMQGAVGQEAIDAAWSAAIAAFSMEAAGYYAWDTTNARCIALDANYGATDAHASTTKGYLPDAQLAWLAAEVAATDKPAVLIFMHHPPHETWVGSEAFDLDDLAALETIVNSRANVFIICGHEHTTNTYTLGSVNIYAREALVEGKYSIARLLTRASGPAELVLSEHTITL